VSYDIELDTPILTDSVGGSAIASGTATAGSPLSPTQTTTGILPFSVSAPTSLIFNQQFEGVLSFYAANSPGTSTFNGNATQTVLSTSAPPGTSSLVLVKVRALIGQNIGWSTQFASTGAAVYVAAAPYDAF
jgi:hypothetical protein